MTPHDRDVTIAGAFVVGAIVTVIGLAFGSVGGLVGFILHGMLVIGAVGWAYRDTSTDKKKRH